MPSKETEMGSCSALKLLSDTLLRRRPEAYSEAGLTPFPVLPTKHSWVRGPPVLTLAWQSYFMGVNGTKEKEKKEREKLSWALLKEVCHHHVAVITDEDCVHRKQSQALCCPRSLESGYTQKSISAFKDQFASPQKDWRDFPHKHPAADSAVLPACCLL